MRSIYFIIIIYLSFIEISFALETRFSAETRLKLENFHNDTVSTSAIASNFRSRLNLDLTSRFYKIYFQLQDSRLLGNQENSPGIAGRINSPPSLHQVYGELDSPLGGKNKIRFGRFEMPLGNQRLFSNNNWNNRGRSFEGFTNERKTKRGKLLFFHLINADLYPMNDQFDYIVDGIYGTTKMSLIKSTEQSIDSEDSYTQNNPLSFEYYIFNENIVVNPGTNTKQRQTLGFRLFKNFKKINIETEYAYQTGRFYSDDIEASLASINLEVPINFTPYIESLSFSKEYLSGDEYLLGGSDGKLGGFAKPFGAAHKFHGYYDNPLHKNFLYNSHAGLNEWFIESKHKLLFNINLSIKYHDFKDAINFDVYGRELDFILSKDLPFGGKIIQGFSIYYPENRSRLESGYFMLIINL